MTGREGRTILRRLYARSHRVRSFPRKLHRSDVPAVQTRLTTLEGTGRTRTWRLRSVHVVSEGVIVKPEEWVRLSMKAFLYMLPRLESIRQASCTGYPRGRMSSANSKLRSSWLRWRFLSSDEFRASLRLVIFDERSQPSRARNQSWYQSERRTHPSTE